MEKRLYPVFNTQTVNPRKFTAIIGDQGHIQRQGVGGDLQIVITNDLPFFLKHGAYLAIKASGFRRHGTNGNQLRQLIQNLKIAGLMLTALRSPKQFSVGNNRNTDCASFHIIKTLQNFRRMVVFDVNKRIRIQKIAHSHQSKFRSWGWVSSRPSDKKSSESWLISSHASPKFYFLGNSTISSPRRKTSTSSTLSWNSLGIRTAYELPLLNTRVVIIANLIIIESMYILAVYTLSRNYNRKMPL